MTRRSDTFDPAAHRAVIATAATQTVLAAAARRLVEAYDDYEDALDRGVSLPELQLFDHEVEFAERTHAALLPGADV